jgi:hypothetical protein
VISVDPLFAELFASTVVFLRRPFVRFIWLPGHAGLLSATEGNRAAEIIRESTVSQIISEIHPFLPLLALVQGQRGGLGCVDPCCAGFGGRF